MIRVAITGNIASGKSVIQNIIENLGYPVLDADIVGHEILTTSQDVKNAFSDIDVFNGDGSVSREKLGKIIFKDTGKKAVLENILHPKIKAKILKFFDENTDKKMCFVGIPLLFEAKMENLFDKIIFVASDEAVRLARLIARNGYDEEYAFSRINSQIPQEEKFPHCNYIIENNGSIDELKRPILQIMSELDPDKAS